MSVFFDTNVLVYLVDGHDPARQAIARERISAHILDRSLVISTQVLQEFYVTVVRQRLLQPEDAVEMVALLSQERVMPSSGDFVLRGITLARHHGISLWDALVVRAAIEAECEVLLSEDLQDGMRFGELRVLNPFALRAHEPDREYEARAPARVRRRRPAY